jgi:DNA-binding protein HU-beta
MENIMVNKASLMRAANKTTGLSLRDASVCIDSIFDTLNEALSRGERIELRGFGSFFVRAVSQKKYPSSFSNQKVISSHFKTVFRPCQKLRETVWNIKNKSISAQIK